MGAALPCAGWAPSKASLGSSSVSASAGVEALAAGRPEEASPAFETDALHEVFIANRRWSGADAPTDGALDSPCAVDAPGTTVDQLVEDTPLLRRGGVGSWAMVPLLLHDEHWLPAPSPKARFELHERSRGVLAVAEYASQPRARGIMTEPGEFVEFVLRSTPTSPADCADNLHSRRSTRIG